MPRLTASRFIVLLALFAFLAVAVCSSAEEYVPLTVEQAKAYMSRVGEDQVAAELVKLDMVEHAIPVVTVPARVYLIEGRDLVVYTPEDGRIDIKVGDALHWTAKIPDERVRGFLPRDWSPLWWGLGGTALGILTGIVGTAFVVGALK